jgi:hypothetical protein
MTGRFITLPQIVKVVWERVLIEDDSDETGAGKIAIRFFTNR